MNVLCILLAIVVLAGAEPISVEDFSSLDRAVEGLMDSWAFLAHRDGLPAGLFTAGTALLRARSEYLSAAEKDTSALPPDVLESWTFYLKASADCIHSYGIAFGGSMEQSAGENLLESFAEWESAGEVFLNTLQDTR